VPSRRAPWVGVSAKAALSEHDVNTMMGTLFDMRVNTEKILDLLRDDDGEEEEEERDLDV